MDGSARWGKGAAILCCHTSCSLSKETGLKGKASGSLLEGRSVCTHPWGYPPHLLRWDTESWKAPGLLRPLRSAPAQLQYSLKVLPDIYFSLQKLQLCQTISNTRFPTPVCLNPPPEPPLMCRCCLVLAGLVLNVRGAHTCLILSVEHGSPCSWAAPGISAGQMRRECNLAV